MLRDRASPRADGSGGRPGSGNEERMAEADDWSEVHGLIYKCPGVVVGHRRPIIS